MSENTTPSLEQRVAILEQTLAQTALAGQGMAQMLQQAGARIAGLEEMIADMLEKMLKSIGALDRKFGIRQVEQSLAQVSRIYPKTRSVIFVGRSFFGDNIKYAYLAFVNYARGKDIACHFLTEDKKQYEMLKAADLPCLPPVLQEWKAEHIRVLLSARIAVLADYFFPHGYSSPLPYAALQGAKLVQLWHGIPIKRIALQNIVPQKITDPGTTEVLAASGAYDVFAGSGAELRPEWEQQLSFRSYVPIGQARDDILFREMAQNDLINVDMDVLSAMQAATREGRPVILYTPTFREHDPQWFDKADIAEFAVYCQAKGILFCINLHPLEHETVRRLRREHPDLPFITPLTDIYPLMKYVSVLMTDYSSLAFDFLLLDRPLIFYRPDHKTYMQNARALIEDRAKMTPGQVVFSGDDLVKAAEAALAAVQQPKSDGFRGERQALRRKFFDHFGAHACERLCELIAQKLGE